MVLGDKEDRRNDRGGWREWAVGPDGIKFGSAGVFKWLRNDLVRVLVRPATADGRLLGGGRRELRRRTIKRSSRADALSPGQWITSPARSSALVCSQCVCIWRGSGARSHWPPLGLDA